MGRSTWQAFLSVAQEGGVRALWRGWAPNCQRAALVQLGDLTTYDFVKHVGALCARQCNVTGAVLHPPF